MRLTKTDAERLAIVECDRRGWKWRTPIEVKEGADYWEFVTGADTLGGNVVVRINAASGEVERAVFYNR